MTGWTTIITMSLGLVAAICAAIGVIIPADEQSAIMAGIIAIAGIILRFRTNTTVFKATSPAPMPTTADVSKPLN